MSCRICACLFLAFILAGSTVSAAAQQHGQPHNQTRYSADRQETHFAEITRPAGAIFAGVVTAVRPTPLVKLNELQTMEISFHVDHAIRGVRAGSILTIHEWAGLWSIGERYRLGEHVLLFLYPPSKLGLTSPVGGALGRFPVDQANLVILKAPRFDPTLSNDQREKPESKHRLSYREFSRAVRRAAEE